jgi:hypothetical protein
MESVTVEQKKRGRFVLECRQGDLIEEIASFPSFSAAETYRTDIGKTGRHNDLIIVDKSVNLVKEEADSTELEALDRQIELANKRAALIKLNEENRRAELAAKGESVQVK